MDKNITNISWSDSVVSYYDGMVCERKPKTCTCGKCDACTGKQGGDRQ